MQSVTSQKLVVFFKKNLWIWYDFNYIEYLNIADFYHPLITYNILYLFKSRVSNLAFLCMERCKSLGSLKSFRWSWGAIWGQYPVFSHPGFPQGLPLHIGEAQLLMTVKSFFTDRAGNIPFLTCIQNSNSTILQYKIKIKTQKKTPK